MDYPNLWKRGLIQAQCRKRADHQCEQCGMEFDEGTNLATHSRNKKGNPMIGTVHHIDENKQNCAMNNLVFLCQSCHMRVHGLRFRPGAYLPSVWRDDVPGWITNRNITYQQSKQMKLFEEIR